MKRENLLEKLRPETNFPSYIATGKKRELDRKKTQ
jgi:hypothetical protein